MKAPISNRRVAILMAAGLVLVAWGSFGFFERLQHGRGGFTYMPDYVINFVEPNGAAGKAGVFLGDRVVSVEGVATFGMGPYLGTWDGVASHIQFASTALLAALLLHFFLEFPQRKSIPGSRLAPWLMFGPWVLLVGCLVLELVFHPRLYHTFGGPGSMLLLAYAALTLAAIAHSFLKTPMRELWASGMGWILLGLMVAMGPSLMVFLATLMIPGLQLPGVGYLLLLLAAIPLSMALAVRRQSRSAAAGAKLAE